MLGFSSRRYLTLGAPLPFYKDIRLRYYYIIGIILGVVGIIMCVANYFIYKVILNKRKAKYAFDIIELANKISENN